VLCGSLPGHFRRTAADFPRHDGYLVPDPQRVAWWKRRVGGGSNGPRIGLSWRGGTSQTRTSLRTLRLQELAPLLRIPGASFVSLQYGPSTADEVAALARDHGMPIVHFPEAIADYDETAALVCALDMVVTVCTSLVHLTGALGQKALVLTPAVAEWRYGIAGDDMPWYPSVRLVRQAPGEPWMEVVERATEDLDRTLRDQVRTGDEERHI
jgi:hypothetical protein